jgi:methyl-accepting chemotaxis protein
MTIVRRIVLGYVGLLLLFCAVIAVGVIEIRSLQSGYSEQNDSVRAHLEAASQISLSAANMRSYAIASVRTFGEQVTDYTTDLEAEAALAMAALDSLAVLETDAAATDGVADLRSKFENYSLVAKDVIVEAVTDPIAALDSVNQQVIPLGKQLEAAADSYSESQKAAEVAEADRLKTNATWMWLVMLIVAVVVVAGGVTLAVVTSRSISRQLRAAVASISSSAAELSAISSEVAAGAAQTAASTNETTATVEEVKQTAMLAHEKAAQVAENSQNLIQYSEGERAGLEFTIASFVQMQNQMGVVSETIDRLSDQTQAVGDIIATVNDLAEQSNLLSVNASIEAAKAGDQGKGFTVVAQEVKNLAEQSKQAVSQVRSILSEIQKAGQAAVQAAQKGREVVDAGKEHLEEAREDTHVLVDSVNEAAQSAVQISASSRQQLAGMEQISQAMESINQASNQSVSGTRQVEQESRNLQELALRLKRLADAEAKDRSEDFHVR